MNESNSFILPDNQKKNRKQDTKEIKRSTALQKCLQKTQKYLE